ncbi:alpha/beta hydrolase family protein [Maricaulis salignorans]|uniref:alpha/beta hydrolase family protein n=1 Tax=Maricaulis salignorans TaxID=144026 RepID=UPI003A91C4DA
MLKSGFVLALGVAGLLTACSGNEALDPAAICHVGVYQTASGSIIDIAPVAGADLRWRALDGQVGRISAGEDGLWSGTTGWTDQANPARFDLGECGTTSLTIEGLDGYDGVAERIPLDIIDTEFESDGLTLAGRLVLPQGAQPVPIAVWVHGSERDSALDWAYAQRIMPAQGVGIFVYDKRGTGASGGEYSQDFQALAGDAAMALQRARELAGPRAGRVGLFGGSQGGWVAPLAATMSDADFVMVSFGMMVAPTDEDASEVQLELRAAGYDDEVLARAAQVTDVTGRLMASGFTDGREDFVRLKQQWGDEDWFRAIEGEYSGQMLDAGVTAFKFVYLNFFDAGTSWGHDSTAVMNQVEVPVLWVLAGQDREAPPDATRDILHQLIAEGRDIDLVEFANTGHGILEFVETGAGRESTRYAEGYFRLLGDWARNGRLEGPYGDARLPEPVVQEP